MTVKDANYLIAGINKEIHVIDMDLYLKEPTEEEVVKKPEIEDDDVLHPLFRFTGLIGSVLTMKVYDNYLYTGLSDQKIMLWDLKRSNSHLSPLPSFCKLIF